MRIRRNSFTRLLAAFVAVALLGSFTPSTVQAATTAPVDLTVTDISLNASDAIVFTLANLDEGSVDAADRVETAYHVDGVNVGVYDSTILSTNDYLTPFGTQTIETSYTLSEGSHLVEVCVDSDYSAIETDETNNCVSEVLTVGEGSGLPDLVMSDVQIWSTADASFVDMTAIPTGADPSLYSFYYTVDNISSTAVETLEGETAAFVNGTDPESSSEYSVAAAIYNWVDLGAWDFLNAGGSNSFSADEVTTSFDVDQLRRGATLEFCVDSGYEVEESDEENNCYLMSNPFYVYPLLPDLAVSSMTLNADNTLHIVVDNLGDADMDAEDDGLFVLRDLTNSEDPVESIDLDMISTNYRVAGGEIAFDTTYSIPGTAAADIEAVVDPENTVEESNGENNTLDASFTPNVSDSGSGSESSSSSGSTSGGGGVGLVVNHHSVSSSSVTTASTGDVVLTSDTGADCAAMPFVDVTADIAAYDAIQTLWCAGVVKGRDATHFAPDESITRGEAAKIVARLFGFVTTDQNALPETSAGLFADVDANYSLSYYIQELTGLGFFTTEKLTGLFRPNDFISAAEVAGLLTEVTGNTVTVDDVTAYKGGETMSRASFAALVVSFY